MLIAQRKKTYCQNCHYPLTDSYNFCPQCGQENTDKRVAFNTLVQEFFANFIAYDSRLAKTVIPFLFKPGFLTNEFNEGRRVKYMHPLRLYFIVSFFYFFALALVYKEDATGVSYGQTKNETKPAEEKEEADEETGLNITINPDSLVREDKDMITIFSKSFSIDFLKDRRTTEVQVIDSLGWKQTLVNKYIIKQAIKFARSDSKSIGAYFTNYMFDKASLLMFFMLPIFALLLKLVYIRRKRYYVEHLTFSLHIHSFVFLVLLLLMLADAMFASEWIGNVASIIILIYGIVAARKVYRQSWIKTILKGFLLFIPYSIFFGIITTIAVIIGGLFY
jgi:hypothetical protein